MQYIFCGTHQARSAQESPLEKFCPYPSMGLEGKEENMLGWGQRLDPGSKCHSLNLEYGCSSSFQQCTFLRLGFRCSSPPPPPFPSHTFSFNTTVPFTVFFSAPPLACLLYFKSPVFLYLPYRVSWVSSFPSPSVTLLLLTPTLFLSIHSILFSILLSQLLPSLSSCLFFKFFSWVFFFFPQLTDLHWKYPGKVPFWAFFWQS